MGSKEKGNEYNIRKLRTFVQYKQTSFLELCNVWDPVRCSLCNKVVFFIVNVKYDDDIGKHPVFELKNICEGCAIIHGIKVISADTVSTLAKNHLKVINLKMVSPNLTTQTCHLCATKNIPCRSYWAKLDGDMPFKFYYCEACFYSGSEDAVSFKEPIAFKLANKQIEVEDEGKFSEIISKGDI